MTVYHEEIIVELGPDCDMSDITNMVREVLRRSGVRDGLVNIFSIGSTAGVTTIEYEPGLKKDFEATMDRIAPKNIEYMHNMRWGDFNGFSHIRASLIKPSLTIPVMDGELVLGTWQQIVIVNFDNRRRRRRILVTCMGD